VTLYIFTITPRGILGTEIGAYQDGEQRARKIHESMADAVICDQQKAISKTARVRRP
jgi:hypothetical protein